MRNIPTTQSGGASITEIATFLEISTSRVRQLVSAMSLQPFFRVGNVPFYDNQSFLLIRNRNKKPGPKQKVRRKGGNRK